MLSPIFVLDPKIIFCYNLVAPLKVAIAKPFSQCVCYWFKLLRWMFHIPCDNWKKLSFIIVYRSTWLGNWKLLMIGLSVNIILNYLKKTAHNLFTITTYLHIYKEVFCKTSPLKLLTLFTMGFLGPAHGWGEGGVKRPTSLLKICRTNLAMIKLGTVIPYLKKI